MAVIQISQIQVRRGYLQDLGQLGSGEFGWAIDKLRLFIGNGTTEEGAPYEGNTEILTTNSDLLGLIARYVYRGFLGGYEVVTGPDIAHPVVRSIQDKLDDHINVKDFGAEGNGITDDTVALQHCIDEIYARHSLVTPITTRRAINFHPGNYIISNDLLVPPYCIFRNTGKGSVVIEQVGTSANCIIKTTDATGASSDMYNNELTTDSYLGSIEMWGITFRSSVPDIPLAIIDSAKSVEFTRCRFEGLTDSPVGPGNDRAVLITSVAATSKTTYFSECDFYKTGIAAEVVSTIGIDDIAFDRCTFANVYQGIQVSSANVSTVSIRITNSVFDNIAAHAIRTDNTVNGVVSAFNTYLNIGSNYDPTGISITPVIDFGGDINYSIADIITRTAENNLIVPAIKHDSEYSISTDATNVSRMGHSYQTVGKSVLIEDSSTNLIPMSPKYRAGLITYSIERDDTIRSGTLKFSMNPTTDQAEFHDSYSESSPVGVDLTIEYNSNSGTSQPYIICVADASGQPSAVTYDIKSLIK
jgi:hypothetical protein